MQLETTFGRFINTRRNMLKLTLRELSKLLDISPAYLDLLENNKKTNPSKEIIYKLIKTLELSKEDCHNFLDLHAKANNAISLDLPDYLMNNDLARKAVRCAKESDDADKEWTVFINKLNNENSGK